MLSVRLPEDLEKRLSTLAETTGRSKSYYMRKAISDNIDDLEDIYLAESRLEDIRAQRSKTHSIQDVVKDLGLEN